MSRKSRDLTTLEFIVLGLISLEPQSGYSIVNYLESETTSWSSSPGSIYPILKRLEQQEIIQGELEMEYETRPRKVYHITEKGEKLLDEWLMEIPNMMPFYQEREIAMWRFLFMEHRLPLAQVIRWLENYRNLVHVTDVATAYHQGTLDALKELGQASIHRQLVVESAIMELNSLRTWLEMALTRLKSIGLQTGEYPQA